MENYIEEQKAEKKIILCWMPPAYIGLPSPAMSVLKAFLCSHGHNVYIEYWNIKFGKLHSEFIWNSYNKLEETSLGLLLFLNYLAVSKNDKQAYERVKSCLMALEPKYTNISTLFYDEHMQLYAEKTNDLLNNIIENYDFEHVLYWGLEINLNQWVCASIIAEKIKQHYPNAKIVIGGIGNRQSAIEYLKNFRQFDFAIWGEGEYPLLQLSNIIRDDAESKISDVANLVYREGTEIRVSNKPNRSFADLSSLSIRPDHHDYMEAMKNRVFNNSLMLFVEGSRGCHWKKCHFCYLNTGYKYRLKNILTIIDEIKFNISHYNIFRFQFLDNDIIGNDYERFDLLLEKLIEIKTEYPEFSIEGAEIITKGINACLIKKMSIAGFNYIQIGYESPSDSLLRKINKKNSFSSNLLFLKFAQQYNLKITGANIIRGLIEETDSDILEGIKNLHCLRFLFSNNFLTHNIVPLIVHSSSPYFKHVKDKIKQWTPAPYLTLLPKDYISDESQVLLYDFFQTSYNIMWDRFILVQEYYKYQKYTYTIIDIDDNVRYREFCNENKINELEFNKQSLDWKILLEINNEVLSVDSLYEKLKQEYLHISKTEIINILDELALENLIFHNIDYSENISIINFQD